MPRFELSHIFDFRTIHPTSGASDWIQIERNAANGGGTSPNDLTLGQTGPTRPNGPVIESIAGPNLAEWPTDGPKYRLEYTMVASRASVVREIQEQIRTGSLRSGNRLPSERSLALEMGVSRATIQAAIRDVEAQGLIQCRPNCRPQVVSGRTMAAANSAQRAGQIAIWILPNLQDLGGTLILQGIRAAFGNHSYRILIGCPPSREREVVEAAEVEFLHSLVDNPDIAGVIVWDTGTPGCGRAYEALMAAKVPLVFIDREPPAPIATDVVSVNNRLAARRAIRHLVSLGHNKIGMVIEHERVSSVQERIEGYEAALREAEIPPNPHYILQLSESDASCEVDPSERLLTDMLKMKEPPTALFAVNDQTALHLLEAAKRLGIAVPERLSIVGFDWLLRWLPGGGELTTVAQPFEEIGRTAAQRLLERIGSSTAEVPRHILLDAPLVIKASSGAPFVPSSFQRVVRVKGESHAKPQGIHAH